MRLKLQKKLPFQQAMQRPFYLPENIAAGHPK